MLFYYKIWCFQSTKAAYQAPPTKKPSYAPPRPTYAPPKPVYKPKGCCQIRKTTPPSKMQVATEIFSSWYLICFLIWLPPSPATSRLHRSRPTTVQLRPRLQSTNRSRNPPIARQLHRKLRTSSMPVILPYTSTNSLQSWSKHTRYVSYHTHYNSPRHQSLYYTPFLHINFHCF